MNDVPGSEGGERRLADAGEAGPGPDAAAPRSSVANRLVVLAFMAVLVAPVVAMGLGLRPENLEARPLATRPRIEPGALLDPAFYASVDRFLNDWFPFRTIAVEFRAIFEYGVARTSPNPDVLIGADDWLFYVGEIDPECDFGATELLATIDALASRASDRGLDLRYVITPDKHAIYPDRIGPAARLGPPCTDDERAEVRSGFAERPGSTVDLWAPIEQLRVDNPNALLYWHQDSHWTPIGATPAIRALVDAAGPGIWDESAVRVDGVLDRATELSRLIGLPRTEPVPRVVVERAKTLERTVVVRPSAIGAGTEPEPGERVVFRYRGVGPDAVIPGTTVFVYDSFFGLYVSMIAPWFEDTIWVHVSDLAAHPELVDAIPSIDRLIVQAVEREAYDRPYATLLEPFLEPR